MIRPCVLLTILVLFVQVFPAFADQKGNSQQLQLLGAPQQQHQQPSTVAPDTEELKDIAGPIPLPVDPVPYILLALLIITILLILVWLFIRWKKNRPVIVPTPAQRAMADLTRARQLFNEGNFIAYAEQISHILRTFIASQFSIKATSQTTHEFLLQVQKNVAADSPLFAYRQLLGDCLEQIDLIKFANFSPQQSEIADLEKTAISFIESCGQTGEEGQ